MTTTRTIRFYLSLFMLTGAIGVISVACQPGGSSGYVDCERGEESCECDLPEDEDPEGDSCAMPADDELTWAWDDEEDEDLTIDEGTDPDESDELSYRFVMIEDRTERVAGDSPGADIDAIAIEKEGLEYYATGVVDFNIGLENNAFVDPTNALGAPDSRCEKQNFVSLGGRQADGFLILDFGGTNGDVTIESGDNIIVYELGHDVCPNQPNWDNDPTAVSISVSDERGSFEELFVTGDGQNVVPVP